MPDVPRKSSGVVVPHQLSWHRKALASFGAGLIWIFSKTWRLTWTHNFGQSQAVGPVIYCVWHSHLMLALFSYDAHARERWQEKGLAAMVSASGDGAVLSEILVKYGVETIRGSTSRRGPQALLEASRWLRKGYSVVITPDGPRGPAHKVQDGILYLAQLSGRPIVPISNFADWKIRMRSWDRFQIPLPFADCELYDNHPVSVPRDASEAEREVLRGKLEEAMHAITRD